MRLEWPLRGNSTAHHPDRLISAEFKCQEKNRHAQKWLWLCKSEEGEPRIAIPHITPPRLLLRDSSRSCQWHKCRVAWGIQQLNILIPGGGGWEYGSCFVSLPHLNALGISQADPNGIQSESGALGSPRNGATSRTEQKRWELSVWKSKDTLGECYPTAIQEKGGRKKRKRWQQEW